MKTRMLPICLSISMAIVPVILLAAPAKAPVAGSVLPDLKLTDLSGKQQTLSQHKGSIVVLDFMSPQCPFSRGVDQSLPELATKYAPKGVIVLAISSNAPIKKEELQQYAGKQQLPYPVLMDTGNIYADAVGAARTPEFYVLDKEQRLVYRGAYDNRKVPDKTGDVNYVRAAIDELLAGKPVTVAQVDAFGCAIQRVQ